MCDLWNYYSHFFCLVLKCLALRPQLSKGARIRLLVANPTKYKRHVAKSPLPAPRKPKDKCSGSGCYWVLNLNSALHSGSSWQGQEQWVHSLSGLCWTIYLPIILHLFHGLLLCPNSFIWKSIWPHKQGQSMPCEVPIWGSGVRNCYCSCIYWYIIHRNNYRLFSYCYCYPDIKSVPCLPPSAPQKQNKKKQQTSQTRHQPPMCQKSHSETRYNMCLRCIR